MKTLFAAAILASLSSGYGAPGNWVDPLKLNANTLRRLEANKKAQTQALARLEVNSRFAFTNVLEQSGITFRHVAVDDAAKNWKPAHYDHGSGLAVADVDADGKLDLYFVNQIGGNELWRNLGGGKFENITAHAGVSMSENISVAAAFGDLDNDGRPDLFITTVRGGNRLFRNLGGGQFQDVTATAGLGSVAAHSSGVVLFDFDKDGSLDLFVCNVGNYTLPEKGSGGFFLAYPDAFKAHLEPARSEQSILYRNLGNFSFRDVSKEMNLEHRGWSGDAVFTDINGDGFMDLYVLNMQGDDRLYENHAGKSFIDKTAAYFPRTPWGAMGAKFFDYNLDGKLDLYVTDMHSDMTQSQTTAGKREFSGKFEKAKSDAWCSTEWTDAFLQGASNNIFGNALWENRGGEAFSEVSQTKGVETYWPWGPSAGDLNADGTEDLFITAGMGYPFRYGINSVLLNDSGKQFVDAEFVLGVEPRQGGLDIEYFTLDCSGADKEHAICHHKKGTIRVLGSTSSRSSALLDYDDDGDLDIITNDMNDRPQILRSSLTDKQKVNYLKIALRGTRSNRSGLGALVRVTAGGKTALQCNDGKSGYLGQSVMPLYFGLGTNNAVSRVEIDWPSGRKQTIAAAVKANQTLTVTEP